MTRDEKKDQLLLIIAKDFMPITWACKLVGIARGTYYNWLKDDPEFAASIERAEAECMQKLIGLAKEDRGGPWKLLSSRFRADFNDQLNLDITGLILVDDDEDRAEDTETAPEAADNSEDDEAQGDTEMRPSIGEDVAAG